MSDELRILIGHDWPRYRNIIREQIAYIGHREERDYRIDCVENIQDLFERARTGDYTHIITSLQYNSHDGEQIGDEPFVISGDRLSELIRSTNPNTRIALVPSGIDNDPNYQQLIGEVIPEEEHFNRVLIELGAPFDIRQLYCFLDIEMEI